MASVPRASACPSEVCAVVSVLCGLAVVEIGLFFVALCFLSGVVGVLYLHHTLSPSHYGHVCMWRMLVVPLMGTAAASHMLLPLVIVRRLVDYTCRGHAQR